MAKTKSKSADIKVLVKPEMVAKYESMSGGDDEVPIISIFIKNMDWQDHKNLLAVGVQGLFGVEKHLKEDDQFRYAIRKSFLSWLDEVTGVS